MPFLENLTEGLASAAGADQAVAGIERRKQRREALSDEERQAKLDLLNNAITGIQAHMGNLDPNSEDYKKLQGYLQEAVTQRTDLFHPATGPSGLRKLGQLLHLRKPSTTPAQLRAATRPRVSEGELLAAGAPVPSPDDLAGLSPADRMKAARIKAGLDPRAVAEKPEAENWVPSTVKLADGREITLQHNTKTGEWTDLAGNSIPKEQLAGAVMAPKSGKALKVGSFGDFVVRLYGQNPTAAQIEDAKKRWTPISQTVGIHTIMVPQPDGSIKPVQVEVESVRGPAGRVGLPKTPGEAKKKAGETAPKPTAGVVSVGESIGGKMTAPQVEAEKKYNDAIRIASIATDTWEHPSAAKDKQLALQIIRGAAGRVNMQEIDMLMKKAGLANTIEAWANSVTTGELPIGIRRQLVNVTRTNLKGAKDARDVAFAGSAGATGGKTPLFATGPNNHKIKSLDGGQTWVDAVTGAPVQ